MFIEMLRLWERNKNLNHNIHRGVSSKNNYLDVDIGWGVGSLMIDGIGFRVKDLHKMNIYFRWF